METQHPNLVRLAFGVTRHTPIKGCLDFASHPDESLRLPFNHDFSADFHPDPQYGYWKSCKPEKAFSDGAQSLTLDMFRALMRNLKPYMQLWKEFRVSAAAAV